MSNINIPKPIRSNPPFPIDVRESLLLLGRRISVARRAFEIKQDELAGRAGISRSTVIEIEKGSPNVSIGCYMAALWSLNLLGDIERIAVIDSDSHRLMADKLPKRVRNG